MELTEAFFCLAIATCLGTAYSTGLECFECNVHQCSRNLTGMPEKYRHETEECKQYQEMMALTNQTAYSEAMHKLNKDFADCEPVLKDECKACFKVDTTVIKRGHHGSEETHTVVSRICGKTKLAYTEDECEVRGPKYARSIVCTCFTDGCNSAPTITYSVLTFATFLFVKILL